LGVEKKVLIELKDIQDLKKEVSKGIFDDSLRIITKDKEEVNDKWYRKIRKILNYVFKLVLFIQHV
jgi:hypothetical protein